MLVVLSFNAALRNTIQVFIGLTINSDHGAEIDILCRCAHREFQGGLFALYDPRYSPRYTPLHIAVCLGHPAVAKLLLSRGADSHVSCDSRQAPLSSTVFHIAALCNDIATIAFALQRLIRTRRSMNKTQMTSRPYIMLAVIMEIESLMHLGS